MNLNQINSVFQSLTAEQGDRGGRRLDAGGDCLQALVETISDGVLLTDASERVVLANAAAAAVLEFDADAAVGRSLADLVNDQLVVNLIRDVGGGGLQPRHYEHTATVDGAVRRHQLTSARVAHATGEPDAVLTILHARDLAQDLAEMKADFVYSVSHELRTPLSSIKAYIEMLVDGEVDDTTTRDEFYRIVQGETNRLSRLIDNMLNISRMESGEVKAHYELVSVGSIVQDALSLLRPQAHAKHLKLDLRGDGAATSATVHGDSDMLQQAVLNLLGNAVKYTPAGGEVAVELEVDASEQQVAIHVLDTGLGIPVESQPRIFEKFYRVPHHKRVAKGTGLGLNLVRHVVETVHRGRIAVASEVGRGSRFTIILSLNDEAAVPTQAGRKDGAFVSRG